MLAMPIDFPPLQTAKRLAGQLSPRPDAKTFYAGISL
jgi:hypothetical protein